MRKVLMTQAMTENGISRFDGLYDENGFPVTAELEKNEDGVVFTLLHKELTEAEKQAVCDEYDDCARLSHPRYMREGLRLRQFVLKKGRINYENQDISDRP